MEETMETRRRTRSSEEWMAIISECRASGMTDIKWCELNGIKTNSFYNATKRLRKQAYTVPTKSCPDSIDLTCKPERQEVVRIDIVDDPAVPQLPDLHKEQEPEHIDNHHTIEIELGGVYLRIANDANPALVSKAIASLRCVVC